MKEAILKLLNENPNYSSTVIAEKLGKSRSTINKYINELNIPRDRKLLQKVLLHNFNINSNIHKTRNQYNIYIKKESVEIFNNLILPFMCPSMKYKLHL